VFALRRLLRLRTAKGAVGHGERLRCLGAALRTLPKHGREIFMGTYHPTHASMATWAGHADGNECPYLRRSQRDLRGPVDGTLRRSQVAS